MNSQPAPPPACAFCGAVLPQWAIQQTYCNAVCQGIHEGTLAVAPRNAPGLGKNK
jgi:hypothetical protein